MVCAEEYKRIRALIMGPGGKGKGLMQQMSKQMGNSRGAMNPHNMQMNIQQMSRMLPPNVCTTSLTQRVLTSIGHRF